MLSVTCEPYMLSIVMQIVVMLSVFMMSVVAPSGVAYANRSENT
jgi:hypothetical protein